MKRACGETGSFELRRGGRDSNPRSRDCPDNHLAGGPIRPLWHLPRQMLKSHKKAEGVGFEPTMGFPIPVFKTGALSRSAIPPLETRFYHTLISVTR